MAVATGLALGAGTLVSPPVRSYLNLLAPGSGDLWAGLGPPPSGPVSSPYGDATIDIDDEGVPHIEADDEHALQFAHGYIQGYDRGFQLDLFRRQMRGELSAAVGEVTLDSDEFHRRMGFLEAAEASHEAIENTETASVLDAFVEGVNHAFETTTPPPETALVGYDIEPWTAVDTLLIEKLIGWQLTGRFRTLRRAALADVFDPTVIDDLFPPLYDHEHPILSSSTGSGLNRNEQVLSVDKETVDWLGQFEAPAGVGSNSWVIHGNATNEGNALLANDPHLALTVPPIWYEVGLSTPDFATRGVVFPGVPFVVIGRSTFAAWGFTNVPADVMDFYRYDIDGDEYRVDGEWREFDTDTVTIEVAGSPDRTIERRRTVHGPLIDRHDSKVAVAWTGLAGTRTIRALRAFQYADSLSAFREALEFWEVPPQNLVYADADGRTMYQLVGSIPIRRTNGDAVRGDRIHDGSAGEGTWAGWEPYTPGTWDDVIPLDDLPHAIDADVVVTANQQVEDEPSAYYADGHAAPYRAMRIHDRLDELRASDDFTLESMISVQQDITSTLASQLVPDILEVVDPDDDEAEAVHSAMAAWDFDMSTDSMAALAWRYWLEAFREVVFGEAFSASGFDQGYWPSDWILATLPPDHAWFDRVGDRAALIERAFERAVEQVDLDETLGDVQRTAIDHPLEVGFLSYPRRPMPGSRHTVKNFRLEAAVGPGWQQVVEPETDRAMGRLAGGNVGRIFSVHYGDQLGDWIEGSYKPLQWSPSPERTISFEGDDG